MKKSVLIAVLLVGAVAVMLFIAIAVIAAVGLYFWVGGLATKPPTVSAPATISAHALICGSSASYKTTIAVANTSPPGTIIDITMMKDSLGNDFGGTSNTDGWMCEKTRLHSREQTVCQLDNSVSKHKFYRGKGTISIYGENTASATITC
ncbi:MAG: hypothetical protein J7K68_00765 [Candidatus Diapherotrites archaeon]|nr:hypothetical protein [Candidatus Diapherotrites archaeon]